MESLDVLYKKVKFFEIEMLQNRGYPIKKIYFNKYFEVMKTYNWLIRLKFNSKPEDINTVENAIYKDEMAVVDRKGVILFFSETLNELMKPINVKTYNLADAEVDNEITKKGYQEEKSIQQKLKINTGIFCDILVIYSTIENIEKVKLQNLYKDIDTFLNFLKNKKSTEYEFDIDKTKELNLLTVVPDNLSSPSDLFNEIRSLFKNVEYFKYAELKFNPTKHVLVPKHDIIDGMDVLKLLKDLKIDPKNISKSLPILKRDDRISRHYLFEKSNVIRIKRHSLIFPDEYIYYYRYVM